MSDIDPHSGFIAPAAAADQATAVAYLRTPLAIRVRAANVLEAGLLGELRHFSIDRARVDVVADRVIAVTRAAYPALRIPVHGRLGHFRAGKVDRVAPLVDAASGGQAAAEALVDLVMVSVLLDAGAGDAWRYREVETGQELARSEGLAVASLRAFEAGLFSADALLPLRVDAAALRGLDDAALARAFQAGPDNPLVGVAGRGALLRRLGEVIDANPALFPGGRPGGLLHALRARGDEVRAADLLHELLEGLGEIWPGRTTLGGVNLGDVWYHGAAGGAGPSTGLMPFHKLSQWLAYSLFEPLELGGLRVVQPGALTGLPEYRNGGLLVDLGVIVPRHDAVTREVHQVGDEVVVEWRALTVALLDWVADAVRQKLEVSAEQLPLARILEGGTWAAGRQVARERRAGGGPPIRVESDGTVF
ncbi:MAG: URC4/urg3 family protein [Kofleriaceae bacterium]|nr:URC4/urg3 family protein [Kofleriaceae bacterium]MCL4226350.1 DUF1688 family protein [Myxococcales bacterium]